MTSTPQERRALVAMSVGLALTVLMTLVPFLDGGTRLLADHVRTGYPSYGQAQVDAAVTTYQYLLAGVGVLGVAAWFWTMRAVRARRRWSRGAAVGAFALAVVVALTALLTPDTSGEAGLAPALGWAGLAPCVAGGIAVVLLWRAPRVSAGTRAA
ncbi:hypothetical protein LEP48_12685 [Isoptericola sp. NEAU-Y5]|uniref:Uncharacterized protein n=1 Tax=Isoptericola luteus TaxID=2879484 RepID=A0ABS7ZGP9_9MICO|nr:hypothetical protein [Isoptericola sp. NEAU-Y5]MCA5894197.1 hypothetical protein [Isoptericola sp. NEAU-Y5]